MGEPQLDIRNLLGVLRRQMKLMLGTIAVVMALAVGFIMLVPPQYSATALVLVDPSQKNLLNPAGGGPVTLSESARVESEVPLVKSRATLLQVIAGENLLGEAALQRGRGFMAASAAEGGAPEEDLLLRLDRMVQVQRLDETFLISIMATTPEPGLSARIANALAGAYIRDQLGSKVNAAEASRDVLKARIEGASAAIVAAATPRQGEIAQAQYDMLLDRLGELETLSFVQVPDSRIAMRAAPPAEPSFPNPRLILVLAFSGSLALAVALALVYETYLGGFTSEAQMEAALRVPVAAAVPLLKRRADEELLSEADRVVTAPLSMFAEAIRKLRLAAEQAGSRARGGEPPRAMVVMVTSALPGEGKTTLALGLARVFAVSGKRALLIDCDLRNPRMHQHLGIEPSAGLREYLRAGEDAPALASILTQDALSGAAVAIGARPSHSATDALVVGETFGRLLDVAAQTFDVVILDTPPVAPAVDALYLARFVDVIVFTSRWSTTSQSEARKALTALDASKRPGAELVAVLQQVRLSRAEYREALSGYYREL